MGPNWERADRRLGKRRLPQGYVAVLNNDDLLGRVIGELHGHAMTEAAAGPSPVGVLFRQVTAGERERIGYRLVDQFGPSRLLEASAVFGVEEGYHYVVNSRGIAHAFNRHSDPTVERLHGQLPLDLADLTRVPQAVQPRNIVAFSEAKGMPRIVYEDRSTGSTLVVVLEIQGSRKWLMMKTAYKRK